MKDNIATIILAIVVLGLCFVLAQQQNAIREATRYQFTEEKLKEYLVYNLSMIQKQVECREKGGEWVDVKYYLSRYPRPAGNDESRTTPYPRCEKTTTEIIK